ncbi:DNA-binding anti-repressor SinI [Bacillus suaedae]|uniref:DNA-binding anti-repressor SinI n=1 Tax=Halalkalibacter suaedae TaxID=2822140 RepID=A0A940WZA7_9BACI|nr:DNA-binding anti-repressor SinI [Bacillus suaedae]MBP3951495.1 DNA-binding anti-repressor SinI [Bacillus suaedae]
MLSVRSHDFNEVNEREWEELLLEAKEIGLSPDEIRQFLKQTNNHTLQIQMVNPLKQFL